MSQFTKIIYYNDVNTPYRELTSLLHEAFKERLDFNLNFGCATFTIEDLKQHTKDGYIVCFFDERKPVAMGVMHVKKKVFARYGIFEYLAVSPNEKYRRKGLGGQVQSECVTLAKKIGLDLITSTTAIDAESSVRCHLKTGFKIYRLKHYPKRNYLSYCFYYPLNRSIVNLSLSLLRKPLVQITKIIIK